MGIPSGYTSAQVVQAVPIPSGVIQVVSTNKTDTFTTTSASFVDITGLSVSITPSSATNKVLVIVTLSVGDDPSVTNTASRLMRDATAINVGDASSSRLQASQQTKSVAANVQTAHAYVFLDSPATTSATTYKVQLATAQAAQTSCVNRSLTDTNSATFARTVSNITVMEISA